MSPTTTDPRKLVLTQAEQAPPPELTVPEPRAMNAEALREVKQLADRRGGRERLRELLNVLLTQGR
jgi:hypothetical protein